MRKICFVTGSRAEFGLLRYLIEGCEVNPNVSTQIIATGAHLSLQHGRTIDEISALGFQVSAEVDLAIGRGEVSDVTHSLAVAVEGFGAALSTLKPDLLVVLGDRYEILGAVSAALIAGVPIAHLHGGETTEGAFDEAIRHSLTKMSHLHFVANEIYAKRVIQMGEHPSRVFTVGGLGVDAIKRAQLLEKAELEKSLGLNFGQRNLMVTYHPVTNDREKDVETLENLCAALSELEDTVCIFTKPNADVGHGGLADVLSHYVDKTENAFLYGSLGQTRYYSCLKFVDGVVGNSSSGLLEAPTFEIGTVNIGSRQNGRLLAKSVINCGSDLIHIRGALETLYSKKFKCELINTVNPYGDGGASERILKVLNSANLDGILQKAFLDIGLPENMADNTKLSDNVENNFDE